MKDSLLRPADVRAIYEPSHTWCAICWCTEPCPSRLNRELEMAHIISRGQAGPRANCPENVLMLCSSCHGAVHVDGYTYRGVRWPNLTLGHLLLAKYELDEWEPQVLATIAGWTAGYIEDQIVGVTWPTEILRMRASRWKSAVDRWRL